jgi:hypothetical protein
MFRFFRELSFRARHPSSLKFTSSIQCGPFSIPQCPRISFPNSSAGISLSLIKYRTLTLVLSPAVRVPRHSRLVARSFQPFFPLRNPVSTAVRILRCSILP